MTKKEIDNLEMEKSSEEVSASYYRADEVAILIGISQSRAYKVIASMRKELIKEGKLPAYYPVGRIPKKEFRKRMMIED